MTERLRTAVICEPIRTPVGRYGGVFRDLPASALAAAVLVELMKRTGLDGSSIDDVIFGQCNPSGEAPNIGRVAALDAGLPVSTPGVQLDRRCGSGLQAVIVAAMQVQTGVTDLVVAGGVESMSQVEHYATGIRWGLRGGDVTLRDRLARGRTHAGGRHHVIEGGMIETAENLRRKYRISRQEQDELAARSHERAVAAQGAGYFDAEIVPVEVSDRRSKVVVTQDEHPRADTTIERLASLTPVMITTDELATVTAGNSSGQNDGAAACLITTPERADSLGLEPLAVLRSWATAGVSPEVMGLGPVPATERALRLAGIEFKELDLIELNEAFAAQVLACLREWSCTPHDYERLNVNGSGISLGHPVGATGGRILATLLHEMRRRGVRYGLETMCVGGGQGVAAVFEAC